MVKRKTSRKRRVRRLGGDFREKFWQSLAGVDYICYYCKTEVKRELPRTHPKKATIDHKKPLRFGGTNDGDNLVVCCYQCNHRKNAMSHREFLDNPLNFLPPEFAPHNYKQKTLQWKFEKKKKVSPMKFKKPDYSKVTVIRKPIRKPKPNEK